MSTYDAPNQQVVRADGSGPWQEGSGGEAGEAQTAAAQSGGATSLDEMTKDELLAHAQQLGITPANASMNKEELRAGIDAYNAQTAAGG